MSNHLASPSLFNSCIADIEELGTEEARYAERRSLIVLVSIVNLVTPSIEAIGNIGPRQSHTTLLHPMLNRGSGSPIVIAGFPYRDIIDSVYQDNRHKIRP